MDKQYLLSVIDKYHLNGTVERTKWQVKDKTLHVKFISVNKDMMGELQARDFDLEDETVAIYNTSQLYKLINVTGQFIVLSLKKQHKISTKLLVADNIYNLEYALSDSMLIPKTPLVEEPGYDLEFKIDKELISDFIKAKRALSDTETVSISTESGLGVSIIRFTIGDKNEHSHKISFEIPSSKPDEFYESIEFNANYIKDIFESNKESEGKGYISKEGLLKLEFKTDKVDVFYFLTAKG